MRKVVSILLSVIMSLMIVTGIEFNSTAQVVQAQTYKSGVSYFEIDKLIYELHKNVRDVKKIVRRNIKNELCSITIYHDGGYVNTVSQVKLKNLYKQLVNSLAHNGKINLLEVKFNNPDVNDAYWQNEFVCDCIDKIVFDSIEGIFGTGVWDNGIGMCPTVNNGIEISWWIPEES